MGRVRKAAEFAGETNSHCWEGTAFFSANSAEKFVGAECEDCSIYVMLVDKVMGRWAGTEMEHIPAFSSELLRYFLA